MVVLTKALAFGDNEPMKVSFIFLLFFTSVCAASVEPHFNRPKSFLRPDQTLETLLVRYLDAATPGSKVFASFYQLKSTAVVRSLLRAHGRGVQLNLVFDDIAREKDYRGTLADLLKVLPESAIFVCPEKGCINVRGNNHNKFFLFEKVSFAGVDVEAVTIQTSHNFKKSQTFNFNDLLIFSANRPVYSAFESYWQSLRDPKRGGEVAGVQRFEDELNTTLYFSPFVTADPYLEELKDFDCGADGEILIMQSFFTDTRGLALLKRLEEIKRHSPDCRIEALLRDNDSHNGLKTEQDASALSFHRINRVRSFGVSVHSKLMLLKGGDGRKRVLTGSLNLTDRSLAGDEAAVAVTSSEAFDAYRAYWEFAKRHTQD